MRVGLGYDVHRLVEGKRLILGGVDIPFGKGLLGHSDADVLVHSIMDALLGAAALGDIGKHFPDNDEKYKDISSIILLKHVKEKLTEYEVGNIDTTVVAQRPHLAEFIPDMVSNIAKVLDIKKRQVNIKATTTEGLGFTGNGDGIAAYSIAVLFPKT